MSLSLCTVFNKLYIHYHPKWISCSVSLNFSCSSVFYYLPDCLQAVGEPLDDSCDADRVDAPG